MIQNSDLTQLHALASKWEVGDKEAGNLFIERVQSLVRYHIRKLSYDRFASRVDGNDLTQIVLQKIAEVAGRGLSLIHI